MAISPLSIATDGYIAPEGGTGDGGNSRSFEGSSAGVASIVAVLQVPTVIAMSGSSAGATSTLAVLKKLRGLVGSSAGVGSTTAALGYAQTLAGISAGLASASGALTSNMVLFGEADGNTDAIGHITGGTDNKPATKLLVMKRKVEEI